MVRKSKSLFHVKVYHWYHTDTVKTWAAFFGGIGHRALVIAEQVLANVSLILSKNLCLLDAGTVHRNSVKAALEVNWKEK